MKRKPSTALQKAYSRGYTAGKKKNAHTQDTVIEALRTQVEYWRQRYIQLRDNSEGSKGNGAMDAAAGR